MRKQRKMLNSWDATVNYFDMFGSSAPQMTIDGKNQVGTSIGLFASIFAIVGMMAFGLIHMYIWVFRHNPSLSEYAQREEKNIKYANFQDLAFTVQHSYTKEFLYDERYMKFYGVISEGDGNEKFQNMKTVGVHKCTTAELGKL